jgi:hypothetical protein
MCAIVSTSVHLVLSYGTNISEPSFVNVWKVDIRVDMHNKVV